MSAKIGRLGAVLVAILLVARSVRADDIDPQDVRTAIDRAIKHLRTTQKNNGTWSDYQSFTDGVTSLCTLALLNAGVAPTDPQIQKTLNHLRRAEPTKTYTVALQLMVFAAAEPKKDLLLIQRRAKWLIDTQNKEGEVAGSWSYPSPAVNGAADNSNTQFALLALYEAERVGVPIPERTWRLALDYWKRAQNDDGSWGYTKNVPGSGSMTSAGISSVIIASGELAAGDAEVIDGKVMCCGQQQPTDLVDNALAWFNKEGRFSVIGNPGLGRIQGTNLYYLYGLERVGRMTAQRYIATHDWYREGVDHLIKIQNRLDGSWQGIGPEADTNIATSFALLFLTKGQRPILVSKLKHGPGNDWNHHRSDLANLTGFVEMRWSKNLTWQIIDPAHASVEDLLQSPVLFISGKKIPEFTDAEQKNLRDYVDRGGFLFAENTCEDKLFDRGFRHMMAEMYPESEYQLAPLSNDHPIWRVEEPVDPDSPYIQEKGKRLEGINVGCRTSIVYCPIKLGCYWELARLGRESKLPKDVQKQVYDARIVGTNVLAYATNRELKPKYEGFATTKHAPPASALDRNKIFVARLRHPGGCNAAPGAIKSLMTLVGDKLKMSVNSEVEEVAMTDPQLFDYHLVFMHGRHGFRLTPAERKGLRTYLERGGVLFADAICSSKPFGDSFRNEMKEIFADEPLERIPVSHPLFTPEFGGQDLAKVHRREPIRGEAGGPLKSQIRETEPYLEGIKLGDRYAVIFSPYDVSCALESKESLECEGYIKEDAAMIGVNVLLYSLHQ